MCPPRVFLMLTRAWCRNIFGKEMTYNSGEKKLRFVQSNNKKQEWAAYRHTTSLTKDTGMQSVIEQNDLNEFMNMVSWSPSSWSAAQQGFTYFTFFLLQGFPHCLVISSKSASFMIETAYMQRMVKVIFCLFYALFVCGIQAVISPPISR